MSYQPSWWHRLLAHAVHGVAFVWGWVQFHVVTLAFRLGAGLRFLLSYVLFWWRTRSVRYFLQSLPALFGVGVGLYFWITYHSATQEALPSRYLKLGEAALKAKDFDTAVVAYQRLAVLNGESAYNRFQLAQAYHGLGNTERSQVLLQLAAPADRVGEPRAHLLRAVQIMQREEKLSSEENQALELHLLRALQGDPDNLQVHALLGRFYLTNDQRNKAKDHLQAACLANPDLNLLLAGIYADENDAELTQKYALRARDYFAHQVSDNLDDQRARLAWAQSLLFLQQHARAVEILSQGLRITSSPVYQNALALTLAQWAESKKDDPSQQLELLERGLSIHPEHPVLLKQLVQLATGKETGKAKDLLQGLLASGDDSAYLPFFLGVEAAKSKQWQAAKVYFEQARKRNPNMPEVANNMAWLILQDKKGDYEYALELVNFALEKAPDQPQVRDTRGQLYVKLKQWDKALEDLQYSLPTHRDDVHTHEALAETYRHLGIPEMADRHKALAKKYKK